MDSCLKKSPKFKYETNQKPLSLTSFVLLSVKSAMILCVSSDICNRTSNVQNEFNLIRY